MEQDPRLTKARPRVVKSALLSVKRGDDIATLRRCDVAMLDAVLRCCDDGRYYSEMLESEFPPISDKVKGEVTFQAEM